MQIAIIDPYACDLESIRSICQLAIDNAVEDLAFFCFLDGQVEAVQSLGHHAKKINLSSWELSARVDLWINRAKGYNEECNTNHEANIHYKNGSNIKINLTNVMRGETAGAIYFLLSKAFCLFRKNTVIFVASTDITAYFAEDILQRLEVEHKIFKEKQYPVKPKLIEKRKINQTLSVNRSIVTFLWAKLLRRKLTLAFSRSPKNIIPHDHIVVGSEIFRLWSFILRKSVVDKVDIVGEPPDIKISDKELIVGYESYLKWFYEIKLPAKSALIASQFKALDTINPKYIYSPKTNNFDGEILWSWTMKKKSKLIHFQHGLLDGLNTGWPRKISADEFLCWHKSKDGIISRKLNPNVIVKHLGHNLGNKIEIKSRTKKNLVADDAGLRVLYAPTSFGGIFLDMEEKEYRTVVEHLKQVSSVKSLCLRLHPKSLLKTMMAGWIEKLGQDDITFDQASLSLDWSRYDILVTTNSTLALDACVAGVVVVLYDWIPFGHPEAEWPDVFLSTTTTAQLTDKITMLSKEDNYKEAYYRQLTYYNKAWA